MSNLKPGPCLVCGVETKNRCSNCAKTGLSNFFCSASHQKLVRVPFFNPLAPGDGGADALLLQVWYAHKHFCGPGKAHPFTWPLLSEDEAREIIANKASDVRDHCGRALVQCLPQYHPDDIDVRRLDRDPALDPALTSAPSKRLIRACTTPGPSYLGDELTSKYLAMFRYVEYMRLVHGGHFQTPNRETDVLRRIAGFYSLFGFSALFPHDSLPTAPLILHQHVVHHALSESSDRTARAGRRDPELKQFAIDSVIRLRHLVNDEPAIPSQGLIGIAKMEEAIISETFHT